MEDKEALWNKVLAQMELELSKANFAMWFKDTFIVKIDDGVVSVGVPSAFIKEWFANKYHKQIFKALRDASEQVRGIEYMIVKSDTRKQAEEDEKKKKRNTFGELPLADLYINKEDNLNPRYTFDSFIIGPFNELAHAAAQAIVKKPVSYNPLFFYGDTGRGKTHLIQAIGNQLKLLDPNKKVYYITSDKFMQEFTSMMLDGKVNVFKDKYKKYDVFIMDDIQFLSKKERTQEELFHLFNYLNDNNKQIIFSSDQHPNYITDLEDRLKSRFVAGMIVDIPAPDYESRAAIIRAKARARNTDLSDDIIEYLATTIEGNIRELEGVVNNISVQMELKGRTLELGELKHLVRDSTKPTKSVSVKDVLKAIAQFYDIDEASIVDKTRKKEVVKPRQIAMYILREDYNISYPAIGQKLGGRDHTTVIHSCDKVKNDIKGNNQLVQELIKIRAML
ncbi:MAG: chromosomal replication initiator protein DnaA [Candidatus Paceibacterota bacterium]|jgi:chromosomal replication initiator protein